MLPWVQCPSKRALSADAPWPTPGFAMPANGPRRGGAPQEARLRRRRPLVDPETRRARSGHGRTLTTTETSAMQPWRIKCGTHRRPRRIRLPRRRIPPRTPRLLPTAHPRRPRPHHRLQRGARRPRTPRRSLRTIRSARRRRPRPLPTRSTGIASSTRTPIGCRARSLRPPSPQGVPSRFGGPRSVPVFFDR